MNISIQEVLNKNAYNKKLVNRAGLYIAAFLTLVVLLFPIVWMLSTSIKPPGEVFAFPPRWIPQNPTLEAFKDAFDSEVIRFIINSLIVAGISAVVATAMGAMTAYPLSRIKFAGRGATMMFFLASMAFPVPLMMVTLYSLFNQLGLLNTYTVLVICHVALTLPVVIWLMTDFFDNLPVEVEESAIMDGAGIWSIIFRIVLPMTRSGLAASAIFVFVTSWNEFIFGLTFIGDVSMRPLPAGISLKFLMEFQYKWPEMMAVGIVATMPILMLFIFAQRYFLEGVTGGAVKG